MLGVSRIAASGSDLFLCNILMQFITLMRPNPTRFNIQSNKILKPMVRPQIVACITEESTLERADLTGEIFFWVYQSRWYRHRCRTIPTKD
jgi:hypothetical protein